MCNTSILLNSHSKHNIIHKHTLTSPQLFSFQLCIIHIFVLKRNLNYYMYSIPIVHFYSNICVIQLYVYCIIDQSIGSKSIINDDRDKVNIQYYKQENHNIVNDIEMTMS